LPPPELSEKYWKFGNAFSEEKINQLTDYFLIHCIINIDDANFPYKSIYKLSENELKILKEYLNKNLEKEYIQYSISSAGTSILYILKKNKNLRLYVDYRSLNKITVKNRPPLFLVKKILDRFNGAAIYTKFNLKKIYYRIRIKKETNENDL
jgi:hypothetical protein